MNVGLRTYQDFKQNNVLGRPTVHVYYNTNKQNFTDNVRVTIRFLFFLGPLDDSGLLEDGVGVVYRAILTVSPAASLQFCFFIGRSSFDLPMPVSKRQLRVYIHVPASWQLHLHILGNQRKPEALNKVSLRS